MKENNLETVTSLSSDLSIRENITTQLEELLIAGNYDEAKLLLEPSQPVDIADAIGSLPLILQALAFRLLKKNEAIEVYEYLDPVVQQTLLERLRSGEVLEIVEKMSPDDRVQLFLKLLLIEVCLIKFAELLDLNIHKPQLPHFSLIIEMLMLAILVEGFQ